LSGSAPHACHPPRVTQALEMAGAGRLTPQRARASKF
jgi:hypothetical protein